MIHCVRLLACVLAVTVLHGYQCANVYRFEGNPFQELGPLIVGSKTLNQLVDGVPIHTQVLYPLQPGTYTPIIFVPGLDGFVFPAYYSTAMSNLASYGYVIIGVEFYLASEEKDRMGMEIGVGKGGMGMEIGDSMKTHADRVFSLLQWMEANLVSRVFRGEDVYNVTVDWNNLGLLSHSEGADTLIKMLQENTTFAQGVAFLEPYSSHLKAPLSYPRLLPSLSFGTGLCTRCCIKGRDYLHFYQNLICPRIVMEAKSYGHCDILNSVPGWNLCHESDICKTVDDNNRDLYREEFIPGLLSSFFGHFLQGSPNLIQLITNPDNMPVQTANLESDLKCA